MSRGRPPGAADQRPRRNRSDATARRERYGGLRRGGMSPADAAAGMGLLAATGHRYERWYQASVAGVILRPGGES